MAYPQTYANQQAAASNLPSAPPKANSLSNAISDFDPCLDRANKYADELRALCDRVVGPRPAELSGVGGPDHPSPLIGRIHERRSRLVAILDDIEGSLQILNSSV